MWAGTPPRLRPCACPTAFIAFDPFQIVTKFPPLVRLLCPLRTVLLPFFSCPSEGGGEAGGVLGDLRAALTYSGSRSPTGASIPRTSLVTSPRRRASSPGGATRVRTQALQNDQPSLTPLIQMGAGC